MNLSIIIVSFNARIALENCLRNVFGLLGGLSSEVIVIDNASNDGSAEIVQHGFSEVRLIQNNRNMGFAMAVNQAAKIAKGKYLILLNPDTIIERGVFANAYKKMEKSSRAGAAGGLLLTPNGATQPSGRMFPSLLNSFLTMTGLASRFPRACFFRRGDRTWAPMEKDALVDWVPGAFTIIRKSVFDQLGGFDERFFLYYEEVDFCRRVKRAGYQVWYWPEIRVVHEGGVSAKTVTSQHFSECGLQITLWNFRSRFLYFYKHHGWLTAWAVKTMELLWHRLRVLLRRNDKTKTAFSKNISKLIKQAWEDTKGGKVSPPQPWA